MWFWRASTTIRWARETANAITECQANSTVQPESWFVPCSVALTPR